MYDDFADMDNEPIKIQEPKPQPIFMKMGETLLKPSLTLKFPLTLL